MTRRALAIAFALLAATAVGCNSDDKKPFQTTNQSPAIEPPPGFKPPEPKAEAKPPAAGAKVELKVAESAEIDAAVKANAGKIVVIDVWATWCGPCKAEFHHLVDLHARRGKDGVACMSVAWDQPEDEEKALRFLTEKGATFPNFLLARDEKDTKKWLDRYDIGAIPVVLVFGRDGKLAKNFFGDADTKFSYVDVNKLVETLLK